MEAVTTKSAKKMIKNEIAAMAAEVKRAKNDDLKLTNKTSLLVTLFNQSMNENGVYRENYWGRSLNGNNIQKLLKNHQKIFACFSDKICTNYPNFPLQDRCEKYKDLFSAFHQVYTKINHSRQVTPEECDQAQACIENYTSQVHSFGWKTSTNKVTGKVVFFGRE